MQNTNVSLYKIMANAYTYSTNYLLFCIAVAFASILCLWIYEKPNFYKLIFKKSKNSTIMSATQSEVILNGSYNRFVTNHEITHKRATEGVKDFEYEKPSVTF